MTSQCFHDGRKKRVKYLTCDTQTLFLSNLKILQFVKCPEKVGTAAVIMVIDTSTRATWSKGSHQYCHCMLERDANAVCFRQPTSASGHWHSCTDAVACVSRRHQKHTVGHYYPAVNAQKTTQRWLTRWQWFVLRCQPATCRGIPSMWRQHNHTTATLNYTLDLVPCLPRKVLIHRQYQQHNNPQKGATDTVTKRVGLSIRQWASSSTCHLS